MIEFAPLARRQNQKTTLAATISLLALGLVAAPAAAQTQYEPAAPIGAYPTAPQAAAPQPAANTVRLPVFIHALAGAWVPWPGTFAENHRPGGAFDLVGGVSLEPLVHQRFDLFVDLVFSQHKLQDRAVIDDKTSTTVAAGYVGARWFFTPQTSGGSPYILAAAGLVYEAYDPNAVHSPPQPNWISMGGVGWELPLGPVFRLGARVTATYLNEGAAVLGWIAPSLTLGAEI